jgi:hypothetical protein
MCWSWQKGLFLLQASKSEEPVGFQENLKPFAAEQALLQDVWSIAV